MKSNNWLGIIVMLGVLGTAGNGYADTQAVSPSVAAPESSSASPAVVEDKKVVKELKQKVQGERAQLKKDKKALRKARHQMKQDKKGAEPSAQTPSSENIQ